jgi:hypothetical protein
VNQTTEDLPDATVTANVIGDFSYDGYSPNKGDIGARYHLTAVGTDSGFQAQTIFGDGINSIDFSNPNLNQAINVCGALTLTVGGGAPYGTIYLYDSTTTGSFYTSATCTGTAITQIAGAATVTLYYTNTTASTPDLMACNTNSAFDCEYFAGAFGVLAANQLETIYGPKLAWTVLPSGGAPGAAFGVQPVLEVLSASGTVLTTSTAPITLKLTGGGTLSCSSNPLNATAGVATFSGCSVTPASANQYCLVASSPGIAPTGATDACFYVTAVSAGTSSVTANPGTVPADGASTSTITVTVKDTLGWQRRSHLYGDRHNRPDGYLHSHRHDRWFHHDRHHYSELLVHHDHVADCSAECKSRYRGSGDSGDAYRHPHRRCNGSPSCQCHGHVYDIHDIRRDRDCVNKCKRSGYVYRLFCSGNRSG